MIRTAESASGTAAVGDADPTRRSLRLCYFGASPDTGNLGVSALCNSVVAGIGRVSATTDLTVFDEGRGVRFESILAGGRPFRFAWCGATQTRRYWRRASYWNVRVSARLGGLGNPAAERLLASDAVLDVSGGDSFTDLYGPKRFASVTFCKRLVLELGKPLILLPQTYGPYRDARSRAVASDIVRRAAMTWARDARSFEVLRDLLGADFDPDRHRCGVDVAFALEARPPRNPLPETVAGWLADAPGRRAEPVAGFNVSGLIWNDPAAARNRYGFKADYRECVLGVLRRTLRESNARIVLVPHVLTPPGHYESDPAANEAVIAALRNDGDERVRRAAQQRLASVPAVYSDPGETKWIISRFDWFCGTRMHACIAGLSSGVPTAAIAYSEKTLGVFEMCSQGKQVADPRAEATEEVVTQISASWDARSDIRMALVEPARRTVQQAEQQIRAIVAPVPAPTRVGAQQEALA